MVSEDVKHHVHRLIYLSAREPVWPSGDWLQYEQRNNPFLSACEPVWPSGKVLLRSVSRRTSVLFLFGFPFSSKGLWFVDTVL